MRHANFVIAPMQTAADMDGKAYVHWKTWHETYTGLMPQPYLDRVTLEKCKVWTRIFPACRCGSARLPTAASPW